MSTRAMIGIKMPDGSVEAIYLHNDGYVMHTGYTLATFYNTEEKIRALLELGELSAIGERPAPAPNEPHSFAAPAEGTTVAYHRDRSEAPRPAKRYATSEAYLAAIEEIVASYLYLFDDNHWLYASQTTTKLLALIKHLNLRNSSEYYKEIAIGSQKHKRYSGKAQSYILEQLPDLNVEGNWRKWRDCNVI